MLQAVPLVLHVLARVSEQVGLAGHELRGFQRALGTDAYTSDCVHCGSIATVVCSVKQYEKFGAAFASRCEAGILPGMSNVLVNGNEVAPPGGLVVENYLMNGITKFKNALRGGKPVSEVILHETVTASSRATVDVLNQRGLGVHFIIGPDGIVRQHGDLVLDELWHASSHNDNSVGIEVVNPYYPKFRPANSPWSTVIDAPWADQGKYVVPTAEQAEACCQVVSWLCGDSTGDIVIPRTWPGLSGQKMAFGRIPGGEKRSPGIWAHYYFGHADGAWLALYCWLRMEAEFGAADAYSQAIIRSTGARGSVDLSDLYTGDRPNLVGV